MQQPIVIKLPEIPRGVSFELHNYFTQLHLNLKELEKEINRLKGQD